MKKIFSQNIFLYLPVLILYAISLFTMSNYEDYFTKHLIWLILSIIIFLIISKINLKKLIKYHYLFYLFCLFLLTFVLLFGREINGAKAWIDLYFFSLQPSEITKISLILTLIILSIKKRHYLLIIITTLLPALLTYLEPDTGAIIIYLIILIICLINSHLHPKTILTITTLFLITITTIIIIYFTNQDLFIKLFGTSIFYRLDRLKSFTTQDNLQIENALTAISTHQKLYFPEAHTDFIFALIISTLPKITPLIILTCYSLILIHLNYKTLNTRHLPKLTYKTIYYILAFQIFQNILMNIGLTPIIGIPLPFLSYGGSSTISLAIIIALAHNFEKHNYKIKKG